MSEKVINVGDEIDSYCTTCKLVLAHQVVALVDGKVEKVVCKTCEKQHKYRPNPPKSQIQQTASPDETSAPASKGGKRPVKKATRTKKSKEPVNKWEELIAARDKSTAKTYAMDGTFEQDEVIMHKTFGYGLVTEVRAEGKMKVLFQEGLKLLAYGQKQ
jgi:uncharacterized Zn finger protein (UPF0148 family)